MTLVYIINPSDLPVVIMKYISISITILDIIAFLISIYFWRFIWQYIPVLAEIYFPDINGIWQGKITFNANSQEKELEAKVRIKQNLWHINIDLCSSTSKSSTLVAYPTIEAGNHKLYYIYHNIPNKPEYPEYKGTAILNIILQAKPMKINGVYYTIRGTNGRIELKQISRNPNEDYEL